MEEGGLNPREGWRNIEEILVLSHDVFSDFGGRPAQIGRQVAKETRVGIPLGARVENG